jgi:integrase/recombinase XerD
MDVDAALHVDWCRDVRGLTPATVRVRAHVLRRLSRHLGKPLREATSADLREWDEAVATGKAQTRSAYRSHAASFYRWLVEVGVVAESPVAVLSSPRAGGRRPAGTRLVELPAGDPTVPGSTAELLDRWVMAMRAAGNAERTHRERRRIIEAVARRTGQEPAQFTADALAGFLAASPSPGTRSTYWGALRAWFVWLVEIEELRTDNPMRRLRRPREPRRRPRPVTDDQLRRLLASGIRSRTRTWILLASRQGLRVHEIAKMRGEDVDLEAGTLRVVGKGGVDALLPLHPLIAAEAARYPATGWWFPSYEGYGRAGEHVVSPTGSITISRAMRRAGVPCTAHQLRHSFGTNVLRTAGGNLRVAQELLRHASVATTALYTQVDDAERRAAILALPA